VVRSTEKEREGEEREKGRREEGMKGRRKKREYPRTRTPTKEKRK
jgi:hypothetical protein